MIGQVLSGRYRLDSKLGSGGMSTVYLGHDLTLDRKVAVKVLNHEISEQPGQLERFGREARDMAKLSHQHVVSVIDAGEDVGRRYIVFECVDGETLKQRIRRLGKLPPDEAAAYAIEVGRGLQAAHGRKLVHRDVKPQNVLIDHEGRAKLTDFGIARTMGAEGMTATGRILGTTDYVSPEQAMGEEVDERSDIYSLGVVLYEMLTGEVPFHAESQVAVAMKHINDPLPDVQLMRPEISSALATVVERATEKDPHRRYRQMAGMLADLETALEVEVSRTGTAHGEATSVLESVPEQRRQLAAPRSSRAGITMGLIGIALIAAILILTGGGPGSGGGERVSLRAAHDFDPDGDQAEHPETTNLAIDGSPAMTGWQTETYTGGEPNLNNKAGVGLYVDAGKPVEVQAVELRSSTPGWNAEIRAAPGPAAPAELAGWKVVGSVEGAERTERVELDSDDYRFYLLWVTRPAEVSGGYRVAIENFELLR